MCIRDRAGFLLNFSSAAAETKPESEPPSSLSGIFYIFWGKCGLLTLGRPSTRCYSTLRAWSPVCGSTLRVSHVRHCFDPVSDLPSSRITSVCWKGQSSHLLRVLQQKAIYDVLKNNLSLLEDLEFTPPSSARIKEDDTRYYVYSYLVRIPTFSS